MPQKVTRFMFLIPIALRDEWERSASTSLCSTKPLILPCLPKLFALCVETVSILCRCASEPRTVTEEWFPSSDQKCVLPCVYVRLVFASTQTMFDPDAGLPRLNKSLVYIGACLIAGMRLARASQVNVRVYPTIIAIDESVELAHAIFNRVFRRVPVSLEKKG